MTIFDQILISLFSSIDGILFGLIGTVYELLIRISNATLFNQDTFDEFSTRIYSLLGVFMLFRLSFSLITYTINPDDLFEKTKGVQNLIGRVLIVLVLLIVTPTIFSRSRELQQIILNNGVLENIILGIGDNSEESAVGGDLYGDSKNTAGIRLSFILLSTFITPDPNLFPSCQSGMYLTGGVNATCLKDLNEVSTVDNVPVGDFIENAWNYSKIGGLLDNNLLKATKKSGTADVSIMRYQYLISTATAIFVVYILVVFCIDIAIRSVKLGFLELVAPIPIISYIDPKGAKDGTFNKWTKLCLATYVDLFLRLASIYFCIFIFDNIDLLTGTTNNVAGDLMVRLFIILGALAFAKQLPEVLKELFPNMKGTWDLNLTKRLNETPGMGLAAAAGAGLGAFAGNTIANKGNVLSGFAGAGSAMMRGLGATMKGKKGNEVYKSAYGGAAQARERHMQAHAAGAKMLGTQVARVQGAIGTKTAADKIKLQQDEYKGFTDKAKGVLDLAGGEMIKKQYDEMSFKDADGEGINMARFKARKTDLELLRGTDMSSLSADQRREMAMHINKEEGFLAKTEKMAQQAFVTNTMMDEKFREKIVDENTRIQIESQVNSLQRLVKGSSDDRMSGQDITTSFIKNEKGEITGGVGEKLKKSMDFINARNVELENAQDTSRARANAEAAKRESNAKK